MTDFQQTIEHYRSLLDDLGRRDPVSVVDQRAYELWQRTRETVAPYLDREAQRAMPPAVAVDLDAPAQLDVDELLSDVESRLRPPAEEVEEQQYYVLRPAERPLIPEIRSRWWALYLPLGFLCLVSASIKLTVTGAVFFLLFTYGLTSLVSIYYRIRRRAIPLGADSPFLFRTGVIVVLSVVVVVIGHSFFRSWWFALLLLLGVPALIGYRLVRRFVR